MYEIGKEELAALARVIESGQFMRYRGGEGGFTETFERELCGKFRVGHALTVNSGTSALICALAALGIGPGDEVIVPAYTWVASAMAVCAAGAVPILADIDETLTLDPADVERKITPYTKAIIPVHMINLVCDMQRIMELAGKHNLLVLEDACQSIGVFYKGQATGAIGHAGAYSFNMYKNITCGEGGALVTNDERTYTRALMYHDAGAFTRNYAASVKEPFFPGVNYRVSELQGAIMGEQLKRLDGIMTKLRKQREIAAGVLSRSRRFSVVRSNDEASAVGLAIIFETSDEAAAFKASRHEVGRLIDSGRHVYTNWEPLLEQRSFHPGMNPFKWARRKIEYSKDMCAKTLEILSRSVHVPVPYELDEKETGKFAESLV